MTQAQIKRMIGKRVFIRFEEVIVRCRIKRAKRSYGVVRYQVRPMKGGGEQWVNANRLVRP